MLYFSSALRILRTGSRRKRQTCPLDQCSQAQRLPCPIYVNLPAQGDTLEFIGDYAELHLDRAQKYYSDYDTIIEHPFWIPDSPPSDTAIRKNITIILTRNKARNTTTLKIMAKPNNTSKKISLTLNVKIFPIFTDPFVITQEPMTSTEGKQ